MKKLSIIIAVYNGEKFIEKCINSISNQTYKTLEIIVIDDASTDKTYEMCNKLKNKDNRIRIYRNQFNMGVSASRNKGINYSTGDYITFVDVDDYIEKDMYNKLLKVLEDDKIGIAMCNFFMQYQEKDIRKNIEKVEILTQTEMFEKIFLSDFFGGFVWNKIYRINIIREKNLKFDEDIHICEDLLFNYKYISSISKGYYTSEKMYHYIQNSDSVYNNYNSNWNSVIEAYERIKVLLNEKNIEDFKYSYLYSVLNLKEKIYLCNINNKDINKIIQEKIKENKMGIYRNKNLTMNTKFKIFIKIYMMKIFIAIKNVRRKK